MYVVYVDWIEGMNGGKRSVYKYAFMYVLPLCGSCKKEVTSKYQQSMRSMQKQRKQKRNTNNKQNLDIKNSPQKMNAIQTYSITVYTHFFGLSFMTRILFIFQCGFFVRYLLKAYQTDDRNQLNNIIIIFPHFDCVWFAACVCSGGPCMYERTHIQIKSKTVFFNTIV